MSISANESQEQGIKLFKQKEYEAAARSFQEASDAYNAAGQRDMAAEMMTNIGLVNRALGENQQALDVMNQALTVFQELNDVLRAAKVLGNMGGVYMALGDREQAYNAYRHAADVFQELGEKALHGETLLAMSQLQIKGGKINAAAATYEAGLSQLDHLSASQRLLKGLLGVRNRLSGANLD
ncbi:MAG: tetratricopeptide repeat protein [Chloroflexota bacterium]|nr:tetratricopeptide repeat protein [Chloroflexota bacterium]